MKKAVITILGTIGGVFDKEKKEFVLNPNISKSVYDGKDVIYLKKEEYINTLSLLIDTFKDEYEIIPIYTKEAETIQKLVLEELEDKKDYINIFENGIFIEDENDFNSVFAKLNDVINSDKYESLIIDVSHGFRHLPLLLLIELMIVNFNNTEKIEKILFAKEIIKFKEYEIIDLKEYLDLANLNYVLTAFDRNYTTSQIKTTKEEYNQFLDLLDEFSSNILANSLDALIKDTNKQKSISSLLLKQIDNILNKKDDLLNYFSSNLKTLKYHIEEIKSFNKEVDYKKFYLFSKNMNDKGYLLNSITLLSEAIGLYCKEELKKVNKDVEKFIEDYEQLVRQLKENNRKFSLYTISNQSKNLYKLGSRFKGNYLEVELKKYYEHNRKANEITKDIKDYISKMKDNLEYKKLQELINDIDILRNNLAHGNASKRLKDVKMDIEELLNKFSYLCLNEKRELKKDDVNKLLEKFNKY